MNSARILLLLKSPSLKMRLAQELEELGHTLLRQGDAGEEGTLHPQVILLDDHTLDSRGVDWCMEVKRQAGQDQVSLILLTSEELIKKFNFSTAIDDFLLAPLNTIELIARIKKVLIRQVVSPAPASIVIDELKIDPGRHQVLVGGEEVPLTRKEFDLLWFLAAHRGTAFSRAILLERVWKYRFDNGSRTIDIHIRRLRKKLGERYGRYLQTVPRVGYKLTEKSG